MSKNPHQRTVDLLKSLDNYSDPAGPAVQLGAERAERELRKTAIDDPVTKYRLTEEGPEQTAAKILAEIEAEEGGIKALRDALDRGDRPFDV